MWIIGAENRLQAVSLFLQFSEGSARARQSVARGHLRVSRVLLNGLLKKKERLLVVKAENYTTYQDLS